MQPGFVRIEYEVASARLRAAYVVGPHAGEMISEFTVAIQHALTMHDLAKVIHPSAPKRSHCGSGSCCRDEHSREILP